MSKEVLVVENLNMHYETLDGPVAAVKDISFSLKEGESFGLVGESGCGKSTLGRMIAGILPPTAGAISFKGVEFTAMSAEEGEAAAVPYQRSKQVLCDFVARKLQPRRGGPRPGTSREVAR